MSAVVSHLATGALFGVVAVLVVGRVVPLSRLEVGVVVLWTAILAVLPDAENLFGMHRDLFTNVWVLVVAPPFVSAARLLHPWSRSAPFRAVVLAFPLCFVSHLWHDLFGFSNRYAQLLWPFSEATFVGQVVRVRGLDDGSVVLVAVLWSVLLLWGWAVLAQRVQGEPRRLYGLAAMLVVGEGLPFLVLAGLGSFSVP